MTREITSRKNALVAHTKKLGHDRAYRYEQQEFLCDGIRLLREAVSCASDVTAIFAVSDKYSQEFATLPVNIVSEDILNHISPLKSPQNVIFSCKIPATRPIDPTARNIVLDGIQDPGNVGTIARTAAAFGIDSVILVGNCADPYNPKTVRATMGAIFRQNIVQTDYVALEDLVQRGMILCGAALGDNSRDIREFDLNTASAAIGSEGAGLSDEVLALCQERIIIPMRPDTESLNAAVAASLLMWEMSKGGSNVNA